MKEPEITVVIPIHNGAAYLRRCLGALQKSTVRYECIVADDGSTDDSAEVARGFGAKVISTGSRSGPAHARNLGASAASSDLLLFIDCDVCVYPETLQQIVSAFSEDPQLDGLIGSYDDAPARQDFLSQYRNLMHHFVHQTARRDACTFWSGCGAIRKSVFLQHAGFQTTYDRPAIEDIELGYRLHRSNCKLILDPTLQVKHLKEWSFLAIIRTDMLDRGIPWTELILRDSVFPNDLNLGISQRISVALAFVLIGVAIVASIQSSLLFLGPFLAFVFLLLAQYEVEVSSEWRIKGSAGTIALVTGIAVCSYIQRLPWIFVCSLLGYLLILCRHHYYSPARKHHRLVTGVCLLYLAGAGLFIASQFPHDRSTLILFLLFSILVVLNARFYILLAEKRGKLYAIAAIPFHFLFHVYNGLAFTLGVVKVGITELIAKARSPKYSRL